MPRPKYEAIKAAHVTPAKLGERAAKRLRRPHRRTPKPRVVVGTAAARALGIGVRV